MSKPLVSRVGGIVSADVAVPDHARQLQFYSRVLTTGERPLWRDDLMNSAGQPIIGLGERVPAYEGLPLQWMPHIQVSDVASSAATALAMGGTELMHGRDDNGTSQWAVLLDPNGAAFGLIPLVSADAMPSSAADASANAPAPTGRIVWVDLTVPNAAETCGFYRSVIGWSVADVEVEDGTGASGDYSMLGGDGEPAAGICHARGLRQSLPPVWMLYLPVGDLSESLRRVDEEGGQTLSVARAPDGTFRHAFIEDLVGLRLALMPAVHSRP